MQIRRLNEQGIERFRQNLHRIREGAATALDPALITDHNLSERAETNVVVEFFSFRTKKEITKYLVEKLNISTDKSLYYDVGLWSWLSVFYFDLVCPSVKGQRRAKADTSYILAEPRNWKRYYRHLLACPVRLYCELGELATPFLEAPVPVWREFHEQLTAYQNIATNKSLIAAATKLYWDPSKNTVKKGASSKGPGGLRRFSEIVGQFELTYDINAMEPDAIVDLLPRPEFSRWLS